MRCVLLGCRQTFESTSLAENQSRKSEFLFVLSVGLSLKRGLTYEIMVGSPIIIIMLVVGV